MARCQPSPKFVLRPFLAYITFVHSLLLTRNLVTWLSFSVGAMEVHLPDCPGSLYQTVRGKHVGNKISSRKPFLFNSVAYTALDTTLQILQKMLQNLVFTLNIYILLSTISVVLNMRIIKYNSIILYIYSEFD